MSSGRHNDVFDQSFDFFSDRNNVETKDDPWRGKAATWEPKQGFDSSFESDPFEFSTAISSIRPVDHNDASTSDLFPENPFKVKEAVEKGSQKLPLGSRIGLIRVAILEQLSALYDSVSAEGSVCVEGSVYVKSLGRSSDPFCVVLRDTMQHVSRIDVQNDICHELPLTPETRKQLKSTEKVVRVSIPSNGKPLSDNDETLILNYVCAQHLRPVPLVRIGCSEACIVA